MIILHNVNDAASRAFVEAHPEADRVIDWYDHDALKSWIAEGGRLDVSSFPAIIDDEANITYPNEV